MSIAHKVEQQDRVYWFSFDLKDTQTVKDVVEVRITDNDTHILTDICGNQTLINKKWQKCEIGSVNLSFTDNKE